MGPGGLGGEERAPGHDDHAASPRGRGHFGIIQASRQPGPQVSSAVREHDIDGREVAVDGVEEGLGAPAQGAAEAFEVTLPHRAAHQFQGGLLEGTGHEHVVHGPQRVKAARDGTAGDHRPHAQARRRHLGQ